MGLDRLLDSCTVRSTDSSRSCARCAVAAAVLLACGCVGAPAAPSETPTQGVPELHAVAVPLPGGAAGIGFDDLGFAAPLHRLLVPAGRTGDLDLVDPVSHKVVALSGFSSQARFESGHGEGTTSADMGNGLLFAIDRSARELVVLDPAVRKVLARAQLASSPDYVRWVAPTHEVWVTEPDAERIEVFGLPKAGSPVPAHEGFVAAPGGPESLVIDAGRGRAFTHTWTGTTLVVDLRTRAIVARWPNGCEGSRGIALDPRRGFLFVGCAEGRAVVLDVDDGGTILSRLDAGAGVDIIGYNPTLGHLYLPGGKSATMAILGVASTGKLRRLATVPTARGAHCVVADDHHQAWVCDPHHGQLLLVDDPLPASDSDH
jgi:hypothetical protein